MKKVNITKKLMAAIKLKSPYYYGAPYHPVFKVSCLGRDGVLDFYYTLSTIKILFKDDYYKNRVILSSELIEVL